jgi:hypothetical protein
MTRDQIIEAVLSASAWEECQGAQRMLALWMAAHPEDIGMLDAGESLSMTMEGLEPPVDTNSLQTSEAAA